MIARLMSAGLPARLEVSRAAARGLSLGGQLPLRLMGRIAGLLADPAGEVAYELGFSRDGQGRDRLTGRLGGTARLTCQRCLRPMDWRFELPLDVQLARSEAEETAARGDCLLIEDDALNPRELIEDELLLALPSAPKHSDPAQCGPAVTGGAKQEPEPARRPFAAALAELKTRK